MVSHGKREICNRTASEISELVKETLHECGGHVPKRLARLYRSLVESDEQIHKVVGWSSGVDEGRFTGHKLLVVDK